MSKNKNKNNHAKRIREQVRAQAGLDRKAYFENGGEMVRWRGLHLVQKDKVKAKNKRACRDWKKNKRGDD